METPRNYIAKPVASHAAQGSSVKVITPDCLAHFAARLTGQRRQGRVRIGTTAPAG
jgi:hypothetical protein